MTKFWLLVLVATFTLSTISPALAVKQLSDAFKAQYVGEKADAGFKQLVDEAKCFVCHVKKEKSKKIRNEFGKALHKAIEKTEFPFAQFKKEPEKYADQLKELFKKVEAEESGDKEHRTFADRIKANLLPGGSVEGEQD